MTIEVLTGTLARAFVREELDDLAARTAAGGPVARSWLEPWLDAFAELEPVVAVARHPDGTPSAALLLEEVRQRRLRVVRFLGQPVTDLTELPGADGPTAMLLAETVVSWLTTGSAPWAVRLEQLRVGDPLTVALAGAFARHRLVEGEGVPVAEVAAHDPERAWGSKNFRKQVRRAWAKLQREHPSAVAVGTQDPGEVADLLVEIERLRRQRDQELQRGTILDTPEGTCFWDAAVGGLARDGRVDVRGVQVDRRLVAYNVAVLDGPVYRVLDGRIDGEFASYSLGRLADDASLQAALAHPDVVRVEWGRGVTESKLRLATSVVATTNLLAWSGPVADLIVHQPRLVREWLWRFKDRHPGVKKAWRRVKSTLPGHRSTEHPAPDAHQGESS